MISCFLFGHGDAPQSVYPVLVEAIEKAADSGTNVFYVGYHGSYDRMAAAALRQIKKTRKDITAILVLPYHPAETQIQMPEDFDGTFYPPLEGVPRKVALLRANQYMIQACDCVICYVRHFGNSRNLLEYAQKQNKAITNIV